jgi:hypothetical protein
MQETAEMPWFATKKRGATSREGVSRKENPALAAAQRFWDDETGDGGDGCEAGEAHSKHEDKGAAASSYATVKYGSRGNDGSLLSVSSSSSETTMH